eukprot:g13376.t1
MRTKFDKEKTSSSGDFNDAQRLLDQLEEDAAFKRFKLDEENHLTYNHKLAFIVVVEALLNTERHESFVFLMESFKLLIHGRSPQAFVDNKTKLLAMLDPESKVYKYMSGDIFSPGRAGKWASFVHPGLHTVGIASTQRSEVTNCAFKKMVTRRGDLRSEGGNILRASLSRRMSAAENVKHRLREYFNFIPAAMVHERCSTHAKEDTEVMMDACLGYNTLTVATGEAAVGSVLDAFIADPTKVNLMIDTNSGEFIDPSDPTAGLAGVHLASRAPVSHFAALVRDQGADNLATFDNGVNKFNGASFAPRWRDSPTPWVLETLAAMPAMLDPGTADCPVQLPPFDFNADDISHSDSNVKEAACANSVSSGKDMGASLREINTLEGIDRVLESTKAFFKHQVEHFHAACGSSLPQSSRYRASIAMDPYGAGAGAEEGAGAATRQGHEDLGFSPQHSYGQRQQQQQQQQGGTKRARLDTHSGNSRGFQYTSGATATAATTSTTAAVGGMRRTQGSSVTGTLAGLPYDDFGGVGAGMGVGMGGSGSGGYGGRMPAPVAAGGRGGGGGGGDLGGCPSPFDAYGGGSGNSGRAMRGGGGPPVGGLGVPEYFGGGTNPTVSDGLIGDGLEEVRGGIVGGAVMHNAAVQQRGSGSGGGRYEYEYGPLSGGTSYASTIGVGGSRVGAGGAEAFSTGIDEGRFGGSGMRAMGAGVGRAYADVRGGMVGGGGGGGYGNNNTADWRGSGGRDASLAYNDYGSEFYPVGRGGDHVGRAPVAMPMARDGGRGGGGGGRVVSHGGGGRGLAMGADGAGGVAVSRNRNLNPDRTGTGGDARAPTQGHGGRDGGGGGGGSGSGDGAGSATVGVGVMQEEDDDDEEAAIKAEGPLGGWSELEAWSFVGLPLEGKTGKRSTREVKGPIYVFEGKRKPGLTGWPKGITWMVSQTWKGSLDNVKWPTSLVGIVLMGFNRPITNVSWPEGLTELHLRGPFDQPVVGAKFPESLTTLSFGASFDQPVEDAEFPEGLEGLYFGDGDKGYERARFNQPLAGMAWPPSLKQLSAGQGYDLPLEGADWPDKLEVINIMGSKKQPLEDIEWPPGLKQIHLNGRCRKEAPKAAWPRDCKVYAWAFSSRAAQDPPASFGTTRVGLSNFSGHNSEQIVFEY